MSRHRGEGLGYGVFVPGITAAIKRTENVQINTEKCTKTLQAWATNTPGIDTHTETHTPLLVQLLVVLPTVNLPPIVYPCVH